MIWWVGVQKCFGRSDIKQWPGVDKSIILIVHYFLPVIFIEGRGRYGQEAGIFSAPSLGYGNPCARVTEFGQRNWNENSAEISFEKDLLVIFF